jgi:hypothetical protein
MSALLSALKRLRARPASPFDFAGELERLLHPSAPVDWLRLAGPIVLAVVAALATGALLAARRGVVRAEPAGRR